MSEPDIGVIERHLRRVLERERRDVTASRCWPSHIRPVSGQRRLPRRWTRWMQNRNRGRTGKNMRRE